MRRFLWCIYFFSLPLYFKGIPNNVFNLYKSVVLIGLFLVYMEDFSWDKFKIEKIFLEGLSILNLYFSQSKGKTSYFILTAIVPTLLVLSLKLEKYEKDFFSWSLAFFLGSCLNVYLYEVSLAGKKVLPFLGIGAKNIYAFNLVVATFFIWSQKKLFSLWGIGITLISFYLIIKSNTYASTLVYFILLFYFLFTSISRSWIKMILIFLVSWAMSYFCLWKRKSIFLKVMVRLKLYWKSSSLYKNTFYGDGFHNYNFIKIGQGSWHHEHNFFLSLGKTAGVIGLSTFIFIIYRFYRLLSSPGKAVFWLFFLFPMQSDNIFYYPPEMVVFFLFLHFLTHREISR